MSMVAGNTPEIHAQAKHPQYNTELVCGNSIDTDFYTRFRRALVRVVASVVDAGAVVLRTVAAAVVFLTATEAACGRAAAVFLAVEEAVPVVAFLAFVPVRVGF